MENKLTQLLENKVLTPDVKTALTEALQEHLAEARQELEVQLREEFAQRYVHDREQLVNTIEKFVTENVSKELKEFKEDRQTQIVASKKNLEKLNEFVLGQLKKEITELHQDRKSFVESKNKYNRQLKEHINKFDKMVKVKLREELTEFAQDKKALNEERKDMHKKLRESRMAYKQAYANRIGALEKFTLKQLTEEITELAQDKKLLAESRVRLESESKKKLDETRQEFIKKSAKLIESTVNKQLRGEITQLKDELQRAKENNFGRRIFEAFGSEFMTSYLAEGTKIRSMENDMVAVKQRLQEEASKAAELRVELENAKRKVKLAEDRAQRVQTLNDLMRPLNNEQKGLMNKMLQGVQTERLTESFNRYLPSVVNQTGKVTVRKKPLTETETIAVTGDKPNNFVTEEETASSAQILELRKLAGIER